MTCTSHVPGARRRCRRLVLALALGLVAAACDSPTRETDDVVGTWTATGEDGAQAYLRITETTIEVFRQDIIADCVERATYDIIDIDGAVFRIGGQVDTFTIGLRRMDEELEVVAFEVAVRYTRTSVDPSTLPECSPPNPGVPCTEPPLVLPGSTIERTLTPADPLNPDGSRYDLYRLELETALDLEIEMSSTELDSRLFVFDADGAVFARNDDASNRTLHAIIKSAFGPGCYVVMATSVAAGEIGDYTLEVRIP